MAAILTYMEITALICNPEMCRLSWTFKEMVLNLRVYTLCST